MSEDHIKTVVIDLPVEKQSKEEQEAVKNPDALDDYDGVATDSALPTSWLS